MEIRPLLTNTLCAINGEGASGGAKGGGKGAWSSQTFDLLFWMIDLKRSIDLR